MAHAAVMRCAKLHDRGPSNNYGYDYLFEKVAPLVRGSHIACCNAEFPVSARLRQARKSCVFNAPKAMVTAIKKAGFDVVNIANNHSYDQGIKGVGETVRAFEEAGLAWVGAGRNRREAHSRRIMKYGDWRVAFLGASAILPKRILDSAPDVPRARYFQIEEMLRSIRAARRNADIVVVNVHWGYEYSRLPSQREKSYARMMMDAGADIVAGHHPHVLQPVIQRRTADGRTSIAAMSLGNFISNQAPRYLYGKSRASYAYQRDGAIITATFEKNGEKVSFTKWNAIPLWTWSDRVEKNACRTCAYNIQVWPLEKAFEDIDLELLSPAIPSKRREYLLRMRTDLQKRGRVTMNHLGVPVNVRSVLSLAETER